MQEFDVVARIQELCQARSWTYYRLAKESGIPYSTLSTMLHKTNVPSVPSLMKICNGFGITLAQFFSDQDEAAKLTTDQKQCLVIWDRLDSTSKELALVYMQGLADRQEYKPSKK
ncbi:helix-turn-helix domain-containing protein [Pseudoflavonifractor phocaeensis]|uniref:helix-turn-helix domain-containing protein n=1 Tax=Pseudoflavonifractor phocaeensis TaxID=1870988 RepID=UPI00195CF239|nr:helix-turn-helix transcriptional regulator [Pseudoflavonifractor phocaeensis]MBM6927402.1 helix-turn-helix transcriptional regulator [Pseudoflavonifractor phocaeensis]